MRRFLIPPGSVLIIPTAAQAPAVAYDPPWNRDEIVAFARRVAREVANGVQRATHYLRALGFELQEALRALLPARAVA